MPHKDESLGPATPSLAHEAQAPAVRVCRDVYKGTRHMRDQRETYLPQFPKEDDDAYNDRLARAVLFNAFKRTVKAMVGMVHRKDPELSEEANSEIAEHLENVDLAGRDMPSFSRDLFEDAEIDGHAHIFVDMQPSPEADSLLEEDEAGLRPYWVAIKKQDILRHSTVTFQGETVLQSFAYHEVTVEKTNEWNEVQVHHVREYWLSDISEEDEEEPEVGVRFRIWKLDPEKEWENAREEDFTTINPAGRKGDVMSISRIPLATAYTGRTGFMRSDPPFEDLAWQNVRHYQTDSDNENLAHTAKVPILTFIGVSEEKVKTVALGPGHGIVIEEEGAKVQWLQADGSDYQAFAEDLQKIEQRMAVMGLSMLMSESRAAETAESKRIDKTESDSQLAAAAKDLESALNEALQFHAEWLDIEEPGSIGVNTDFEDAPLDSAVFREFRELWAERGISWETLIGIAERGEVLPPGFDLDEERRRIAEEDGRRMDAASEELFGSGAGGEEEEGGEQEGEEGEMEPAA